MECEHLLTMASIAWLMLGSGICLAQSYCFLSWLINSRKEGQTIWSTALNISQDGY